MKDRRAFFRIGLNALYLPLYDQLCSLLPARWQPISGLRSFEEQNDDYAKGRTQPGPVVTRARGGMSFHNYGLASDWGIFLPDWTPIPIEDPRWKEYHGACTKLGLRLISWDAPHNEFPAKTPVDRLCEAYEAYDLETVQKLLMKEGSTDG